MLPEPLDEVVGLTYLLMRIVDTIEDDVSIDDATRRQWLLEFDAVLLGEAGATTTPAKIKESLGAHDAERALMRAADEVIARLRACGESYAGAAFVCARKMIAGVVKLLDRAAQRSKPYPAVADLDELREYCYYVAGVVGEFLVASIGGYLHRDDIASMDPEGIELGLGLQLCNILKDAARDSEDGRRYLPMTAAGDGDAAGRTFDEVSTHARACLRGGQKFILAIPPEESGIRKFAGLPWVWATLTIARTESTPTAGKINRAAITETIDRFEAIAADDAALTAWFEELLAHTPSAIS